jgi:uncharacterized protein YggE
MLLNNSFRRITVRAALVAAMAPGAVIAQSGDAAVPQLTAHGRGEVDVIPDRCEVVWQVVTRAATAGRASEMNAAAVRAVLDTLRRGFGLTDRDLSTAGYSLQPQMAYPQDGKPPQLVGYVATNSVRVRTSLLDRIGALLDAAVAKGATNVSGLSFYAANVGEPRRRALTIAVEAARQDADAMARAAGGRLGQLIEITTEYASDPRPIARVGMAEMSMARVAETPIQATDVTVTATITARWRFLPGGG